MSKTEAKQLDSITDHHVETEGDQRKSENAFKKLKDGEAERKKEKLAREKKLAAVKVAKGDVEVLINELDMEKNVAERALREHGGDLSKTLTYLVNN